MIRKLILDSCEQRRNGARECSGRVQRKSRAGMVAEGGVDGGAAHDVVKSGRPTLNKVKGRLVGLFARSEIL